MRMLQIVTTLNITNECYDVLHTTTYGNLGDIKEVNENTFPDCDLVTYSFPCKIFQYLEYKEVFNKVQEVDYYLKLKEF